MSTYMLVAGHWLGSWAWSEVTALLRAMRQDVFPVTLTGLGDRAHLASPDVCLETHVLDIVNTIEYADLHDVVLVGHSAGGMAVTGAADRIPERLSRLVYVDSAPYPDGTAQFDVYAPERRAREERRIAEEGDGWRLPLPSWDELGGTNVTGLGRTQRQLMAARATAQPARTLTDPLRLANPTRERIPHTLITCTYPLDRIQAMMARGDSAYAGFTGKRWTYQELPTGHWPMFSEPEKLAGILASLN